MAASKKKYKPTLKAGMWPVIDSPEAARWAVKQGFGAALFCTVVTAGIAIWSHYSTDMAAMSGLDIFALADAALFLFIAVGLHFNSRVAAVLGLGFYLLERALVIGNTQPSTVVMIVIIIVCFISAVRGTFAFHRFKRDTPEPPDAPIEP